MSYHHLRHYVTCRDIMRTIPSEQPINDVTAARSWESSALLADVTIPPSRVPEDATVTADLFFCSDIIQQGVHDAACFAIPKSSTVVANFKVCSNEHLP